MRGKYFLALLSFLFLYQTAYTQCSITSPSTACKGEVIELKAVSSTTIDSVRWDFGDQSTGKQTKLNHIYTSSGTFDIKLRVYDTNGDSCDASAKIIVYDPPDLKVSLDTNSNYCFSNNNICLLDSSKRGSSNGKIVKRTILWGDGNRSLTNNPSIPSKICHSYLKDGKFTITIQEENQYGCIAEKTIDINIKEDFSFKFREEYVKETCDWEEHLFLTDTILNNTIDSFVWDFDDGQFDRTYFDSAVNRFFNKGTYEVSLTVYSKNGCINKVSKNVVVDFPEIKIIASVSKDTVCVNNTVVLEADKKYGDEWIWVVNGPKETTRLDGRLTYFTPTELGRYKATLQIKDQGCSKVAFIDSLEVVGVKTNFELLNKSQCGNNDTVFACNLSEKYGTNNYSFTWNFGDSLASQCHSDSASNYKLDSNCNFHTGVNAKHFYNQEYCGRVTLVAIDHQNQCVDSLKDDVTLLTTSKDAFGYIAPNRCLGGGIDNTIKFLRQPCLKGIKVNYDSACDKDNFVGFIDFFSYKTTCDTNGNVTVGFAISNGSDKIYQSCDTSDYILSNQNLCVDTIWYHHWFTLSDPPIPKFFIDTNERCAPAKMKFTLYNPHQTNITKAEWLWGDGTSSEFTYVPGTYDSLPSQYHDYDRESEYDLRLTLETDSGCKQEYHWDFELGYSNDFYLNDTCVNDTVELYDTLRYWNSNTRAWRDVSNPNLGLIWDFDDGKGFSTTGPLPKIVYDQPGKYNIRMASWDEYGCSDTVEHEITITCAVAGIKKMNDTLLCGGIVRFLDSSSTKLGLGRIVDHYWEFGDGTTPSYIQNPFHYYRKFGTFKVTHIVTTDNGCTDTATFNMVVAGPTSEFDFVGDSIGCAPFTVELDNKSKNASRYIWEFGDNNNVKVTTFSDTNMTFTYRQAGTYYIRLLALDSIWDPNINDYIYCEAYYPDSIEHPNIFKKVIVQDSPEADFILPDKICKNEILTLIGSADTAYKKHHWTIKKGQQEVEVINDTLYFHVLDTGTFQVSYAPSYPVAPPLKNCFDTAIKTIYSSGSEAFFEYTQADDCPIFTFKSLSENGDTLIWDFGDPESDQNSSNAKEVTHQYKNLEPDAQVCLIAINKDGCRDTFCDALQSESNVKIFIPNIFTPNRDDYNNEYEIEIEGETSYELLIYNRWGELVYESHQDSELGDGKNWNGKFRNTGKEVSEGVYFFIFRYELNCGSTSDEVEGTITLIR